MSPEKPHRRAFSLVFAASIGVSVAPGRLTAAVDSPWEVEASSGMANKASDGNIRFFFMFLMVCGFMLVPEWNPRIGLYPSELQHGRSLAAPDTRRIDRIGFN